MVFPLVCLSAFSKVGVAIAKSLLIFVRKFLVSSL